METPFLLILDSRLNTNQVVRVPVLLPIKLTYRKFIAYLRDKRL